jgi:hypothetical protein
MYRAPKPIPHFREIWQKALAVYVSNRKVFLILAIASGGAGSVLAVATIWMALGDPLKTAVDPQALFYSLTSTQWIGLGTGLLGIALSLAFGLAAAVHAAAEPGIRVPQALARITANSMQIFWLQFIVYALAARYSPWAGLLLWVLAGFAIPVALLENLGPADAVDRAWEVSRGARGRILAAELLLPLLPLAVMLGAGFLVGPRGPLRDVSGVLRAGVLCMLGLGMLMLVQFGFVTLTRIYLALTFEPALHVRAASNVSS